MATTDQIEQTQLLLEEKLTRRMAVFEQQLSAVKEGPHNPKLESLVQEFHEFKVFTIEMLAMIRQQITNIQLTVDELETKNRSDCLLLKGVPEKPGENVYQTVVKVLKDKLNIHTEEHQTFRACYRLGTGGDGVTRSILVRFCDPRLRHQVWSNKTKFKSSPFSCAEFLIKNRHQLFVEARKVFGVQHSWTQDGCITVKLPDGSKVKILQRSDLTSAISALKKSNTVPRNDLAPKERQRRAVAKK